MASSAGVPLCAPSTSSDFPFLTLLPIPRSKIPLIQHCLLFLLPTGPHAADPLLRNDIGKSALDLAREQHLTAMVRLIEVSFLELARSPLPPPFVASFPCDTVRMYELALLSSSSLTVHKGTVAACCGCMLSLPLPPVRVSECRAEWVCSRASCASSCCPTPS